MNRTWITKLCLSIAGEFISLVAFLRVLRSTGSGPVAQDIITEAVKRFGIKNIDGTIVSGLVDLAKDRIDLVDLRRRVFAAALIALAGSLAAAADENFRGVGLIVGTVWIGIAIVSLGPSGVEAPTRREVKRHRLTLLWGFFSWLSISVLIKVVTLVRMLKKL
jgi:hypothetical protein